ncbi:hypothetical protein XFF6166_10039 [Xanthomonas citri pv. fuscans]|nr:hypothetical protein XFF6166_10039 [Xanthomonas citri pv. fuscans]SOO02347.1 hypothetical protein XFF6960_590163 [Xanthomonas citri pv. fuscans]SOO06633.1 hypothetical protein XFF7767_80041 [Xanthomonas citri pv. fuscans]SOO11244.1 hypothetical protein XFF6970_70175 [Xanthomonas citri pv. fuscans]SOO16188.1 hypothetical protein XFF7766_770040 [Xanthomonas citri pv. fuscans]
MAVYVASVTADRAASVPARHLATPYLARHFDVDAAASEGPPANRQRPCITGIRLGETAARRCDACRVIAPQTSRCNGMLHAADAVSDTAGANAGCRCGLTRPWLRRPV